MDTTCFTVLECPNWLQEAIYKLENGVAIIATIPKTHPVWALEGQGASIAPHPIILMTSSALLLGSLLRPPQLPLSRPGGLIPATNLLNNSRLPHQCLEQKSFLGLLTGRLNTLKLVQPELWHRFLPNSRKPSPILRERERNKETTMTTKTRETLTLKSEC